MCICQSNELKLGDVLKAMQEAQNRFWFQALIIEQYEILETFYHFERTYQIGSIPPCKKKNIIWPFLECAHSRSRVCVWEEERERGWREWERRELGGNKRYESI